MIPLLNEEESLQELHDWIVAVMQKHNYTYEIVFVDDGSTDRSWSILEHLSDLNPAVKAIKFRGNHGKSPALNAAFRVVSGDVIITMDADLQDNPEEIPELYDLITKEGYDLISGWKKKRYDPLSKTLPTKLFNWAARKASGLQLHDFNCGLKAYKLEVVQNINVYGEMHRYIPILAQSAGFGRIGEKVVQHQARKYGTTKFGIDRFINGLLDLITIVVLRKFGKRPMHFFGAFGTLMFFIGFTAAAAIGALKLYRLANGEKTILVTDNPWFYIALTSMLIGTQFFMTGFIGELMQRSRRKEQELRINKTIHFSGVQNQLLEE